MKTKWWKIASIVKFFVGVDVFVYLQSKLKFFFNFRNDYHFGGNLSCFDSQTYVFMIDGKTIHGGLSDRLRGAFSVYAYCKENRKQFKIYWKYPFCLYDYLRPAKINWLIEDNKDSICYNLSDVSFKFFNSYCELNGRTTKYFKFLRSNKKEIHVYSNITINEDQYAAYFAELFVPSPELEKAVSICRKEIGGEYISVTFRFIGLLGDFVDDNRFLHSHDRTDASYYIQKCIGFIERLHIEYSQYKLLVTADSNLFLSKVKDIEYVYVIPGKLEHMDRTKNDSFSLHLKAFLDFFMVSYAQKCFAYSTGDMFRDTKFAKTASLIGGKMIQEVYE